MVINLIILILFFILLSRPTHAYLDPGSGSFIIQMLIAAVLGGMVTVKVYFKKIKVFFKKLFKQKPDNEDDKH